MSLYAVLYARARARNKKCSFNIRGSSDNLHRNVRYDSLRAQKEILGEGEGLKEKIFDELR